MRKLLSRESYEILDSCGRIMDELTGEEFLPIAAGDLELDRYCPRLKIALEFTGPHFYTLPAKYTKIYDHHDAYADVTRGIDMIRAEVCADLGIAVIKVYWMWPERLREYLIRELHRLTKYRVWVGSPRKRPV